MELMKAPHTVTRRHPNRRMKTLARGPWKENEKTVNVLEINTFYNEVVLQIKIEEKIFRSIFDGNIVVIMKKGKRSLINLNPFNVILKVQCDPHNEYHIS